MAERMLALPIGGVDDMAVWAGFVWERLARWIDQGPPPDPHPRAPAPEGTAPSAAKGKARPLAPSSPISSCCSPELPGPVFSVLQTTPLTEMPA